MAERAEHVVLISPFARVRDLNDLLLAKVERAVHLASELGADAFDAIEGRGLNVYRHEIAADITALRQDAIRYRTLREALFRGYARWPDGLWSQLAHIHSDQLSREVIDAALDDGLLLP